MTDDDKLLVLPLGQESKLITQTIANDTARQILELLADGAMSTSAIAKKLDIPLTTAQYNVEKLIEAGLVVVEKTKYSEKGREVKLYGPARRMIVLVPKNTSSQAVMDILKKYLVLLPVALFMSLLVEIAMQLRNAGSFGLWSLGGMSSKMAGEGNDSLALSSAGNVTGGRAAEGLLNASVGSPPPMPGITNATSGVAGAVDALNKTVSSPLDLTAGPTGVPELINQHAGAAPSLLDQAGQAISSADLLGHYGLWFFVGCLLIISILVIYEVYKGRAQKK